MPGAGGATRPVVCRELKSALSLLFLFLRIWGAGRHFQPLFGPYPAGPGRAPAPARRQREGGGGGATSPMSPWGAPVGSWRSALPGYNSPKLRLNIFQAKRLVCVNYFTYQPAAVTFLGQSPSPPHDSAQSSGSGRCGAQPDSRECARHSREMLGGEPGAATPRRILFKCQKPELKSINREDRLCWGEGVSELLFCSTSKLRTCSPGFMKPDVLPAQRERNWGRLEVL